MAGRRIAIVGSRHYPRSDLVAAFVASLPADAVVVSGGAAGIDSFAEGAATARGLSTLIFRADWDGLGRKAGPIRNGQIVVASDEIVAFWDTRSRGTLHTIVTALEQRKPVRIFDANGVEVPLSQALAAAEDRGVLASVRAARTREQK